MNPKYAARTVFRLLAVPLIIGLAVSCFSDSGTDEKEEEETSGNRFEFIRDEEVPTRAGTRETQENETVELPSPDGDALTPEQVKILEKNGRKPKKNNAGRPSVTPFYEDFIVLDADEKVTASLVFNSAPVLDVLPAFADLLSFNFVADPDLKGTVTLNLNSAMTKRELWNTFERLLFLSGAGVSVSDSVLRIMPLAKLAQQPDLAVSDGADSEVCYFPVKNGTAKDLAAQIKPFLGKDSAAMELTRPNALLVSDSRANIPKIKQLLDIIDSSGRTNWPRAVVKCRNILPSKITEELKAVLPILGFYVLETTDKAVQPGSIQISGIDRLQIIVASAATQEAITEIRDWVEMLDSAKSLDRERVFVYKVMHNKADDLLNALSVIYNVSGSSLTLDSDTGDSRTTNVNTPAANNNTRRTTTGTTTGTNRTGAVTAASGTQTDQTSNIFDNPVKIFADGVLNRLVVRTTPRTYASIKALLDRLDVVPAQVLLQVLVVEVTLSKSTEFGLELAASGQLFGENFTLGQTFSGMNPDLGTTATDGTVSGIGNTKETGLTMLLADPNNPQNKFGYIRALAGNSKVKIVSSPQVLVSSHSEAVVSIGDDFPYVKNALTDTASSTSTSSTYNTSVEYRQTGVTLTITPQITSTDLISLDVLQELSSVTANTITKLDSPVFPTRSIKTKMTIRNGHTMVIGGLIQEEKQDNLDSIPVLIDIPIIRRLFGNTDANVKRSEILVLITGYIVSEKDRVEDMIRRYNSAIKALNDFDYTLGDRPGANTHPSAFDGRDMGLRNRNSSGKSKK